MRTPTEMDEIKANFFSKNEKMLMSQFTASRAIAIMSSSRRKRREEVGDKSLIIIFSGKKKIFRTFQLFNFLIRPSNEPLF